MLTRLSVRNFKTLEALDIELGQSVVFIGPNNSGKTSALQAISLWQTGLREWSGRRSSTRARERTGVTINRRDLTHTPVRESRQLWRHQQVNQSTRDRNGAQDTQHVYIDILIGGQARTAQWQCGLEFYHANPESLYCRPMRAETAEAAGRMEVPQEAVAERIAFLPPMSGLVTEEPELQPGRIDVLIGEGQTAQVLRNLCLRVLTMTHAGWDDIARRIQDMFGAKLGTPRREPARGSVELTYRERLTNGDMGPELDIASSGRGMQQTLLLLAHMHANPGAVLLLDEPDAHLEILRQREIYNMLTDAAETSGSQIIAASHSEVVLNEAADRDMVIAFVGTPHRLVGGGAQVRKALAEIGFDQYYLAMTRPGVLYLEGSTDLAVLRAFAVLLDHPAQAALQEPFLKTVGNQPREAERHYFALREARPALRAFAVFDRPAGEAPHDLAIPAHWWRRREIENYLSSRTVLLRFAAGADTDDLLARAESARRAAAMEQALAQVEQALTTLGRDPWGDDVKPSDDVLPVVFRLFYAELGLKNEMNKNDYHELVRYLPAGNVDPEVIGVLDRIHEILGASP